MKEQKGEEKLVCYADGGKGMLLPVREGIFFGLNVRERE